MKISIVTAVYDRASTIGRSMQSFQAQNWPEREQVIVDGASRDATLQIARTCSNDQTIILSEPDQGIYDAINKGISMATGEVIGMLHSDDLFADETVLRQVADIFSDPQIDIAYADAVFFNRDRPDRIVRRYNSAKFSLSSIAQGWMPAHTTMFARRNVFDRFGLYRTDYQIAADFEFIARVFGSGKIESRYAPQIWVKMQTGGASTAGFRSKLVLNKEVLRACRENGIDTSYPRLLSKYPAKLRELFGF